MRSAEHKALVAVDLGAQSCRVSLLRFLHGTPYTGVVHRFRNAPVVTPAGVRWDIAAILEQHEHRQRPLLAALDLVSIGNRLPRAHLLRRARRHDRARRIHRQRVDRVLAAGQRAG